MQNDTEINDTESTEIPRQIPTVNINIQQLIERALKALEPENIYQTLANIRNKTDDTSEEETQI